MLHSASVISHGGSIFSFNHSRAALAWSAIAFSYAILAMANLTRFGSETFHLIFSLRLVVCLLAAGMTLWTLGELPLTKTITRGLFASVFALELGLSLQMGKLSDALLLLAAVAVAAAFNVKRDQRFAFENVGRGLKPTIRRQRDLIAELRDSAAKLKETLQPTIQLASATLKSGDRMFAHEERAIQSSPVIKSNGPVQGMETITQLCASIVEAKRAKYLGIKRAHLVLAASRKFDIPVQVMIEADDFQKIVGACIDYATASLSGGEGLVRLSVSTGVRHVTLSIEDNGYGISEERLAMTDTDEKMTFAQLRGLAAFWGARLVRNARLGVGSRVVLELPRTDAFVYEGRTPEPPTVKRSTDLELPLA